MSARDRGLPSRRKMRHDRHFVEELARRAGEGIGRMVPVELIASSENQPRAHLGDLSDLVSSIAAHGVLEPLLVRRRPDGHGYELVSGERRFHAAVQAGLEEVPCIVLEVEDNHALEIALIENLQRKDLSPFEEAEGFQGLVEKYGYTHEKVAAAVGRSRVTVTETLSLLKIPPEIRDMCRHADITAKGMLLQIARAGDPAAMAELVQRIVEERLDRGELRKLRSADEESEPSATTDAGANDSEPQESPNATGARRRTRPYTIRIEDPDSDLRLSLSIRTAGSDEAGPPSPEKLIAALERLLAELREKGEEILNSGKGKGGSTPEADRD